MFWLRGSTRLRKRSDDLMMMSTDYEERSGLNLKPQLSEVDLGNVHVAVYVGT